jgi:hypothetical protein
LRAVRTGTQPRRGTMMVDHAATPKRAMECDSPTSPDRKHIAKRPARAGSPEQSPAISWEVKGRGALALSPVREQDDNSTEPDSWCAALRARAARATRSPLAPRPAHSATAGLRSARRAPARVRSDRSLASGGLLPTPQRTKSHGSLFAIRRPKSPVPFPGSISLHVCRSSISLGAPAGRAHASRVLTPSCPRPASPPLSDATPRCASALRSCSTARARSRALLRQSARAVPCASALPTLATRTRAAACAALPLGWGAAESRAARSPSRRCTAHTRASRRMRSLRRRHTLTALALLALPPPCGRARAGARAALLPVRVAQRQRLALRRRLRAARADRRGLLRHGLQMPEARRRLLLRGQDDAQADALGGAAAGDAA